MDPMIRVGVDVGCKTHQVGIAGPDGTILEEFSITHTQEGFTEFFTRIEHHQCNLGLPVAVAMEGYNGHARPLDRMILEKGYILYNVNNLKLARFREIFPGPAKTDSLDVRKILELFHLKDYLPLAKDVLQEVPEVPKENEKLKRLTRRRRQLVQEKVRVMRRLQADLQAVCPELLGLSRKVDNLWFLRFLASRDDLEELAQIAPAEIQGIPGIGAKYAGIIRGWQRQAEFSPEVEYVGPMIVADARRILELPSEIAALEESIEKHSRESELARRLRSWRGRSGRWSGSAPRPVWRCTWGCVRWTNNRGSSMAPGAPDKLISGLRQR